MIFKYTVFRGKIVGVYNHFEQTLTPEGHENFLFDDQKLVFAEDSTTILDVEETKKLNPYYDILDFWKYTGSVPYKPLDVDYTGKSGSGDLSLDLPFFCCEWGLDITLNLLSPDSSWQIKFDDTNAVTIKRNENSELLVEYYDQSSTALTLTSGIVRVIISALNDRAKWWLRTAEGTIASGEFAKDYIKPTNKVDLNVSNVVILDKEYLARPFTVLPNELLSNLIIRGIDTNRYKGTIATKEALKALTNAKDGETYYVSELNNFVVFDADGTEGLYKPNEGSGVWIQPGKDPEVLYKTWETLSNPLVEDERFVITGLTGGTYNLNPDKYYDFIVSESLAGQAKGATLNIDEINRYSLIGEAEENTVPYIKDIELALFTKASNSYGIFNTVRFYDKDGNVYPNEVWKCTAASVQVNVGRYAEQVNGHSGSRKWTHYTFEYIGGDSANGLSAVEANYRGDFESIHLVYIYVTTTERKHTIGISDPAYDFRGTTKVTINPIEFISDSYQIATLTQHDSGLTERVELENKRALQAFIEFGKSYSIPANRYYDGYWATITNTTSVTKNITFSGFQEAFFRDGSSNSVISSPFDIPGNTTYRISVSKIDNEKFLHVMPYGGGTTQTQSITLLDEDDFASNSATAAPSQQSVKAYVDAIGEALKPEVITANGDVTVSATDRKYYFLYGTGYVNVKLPLSPRSNSNFFITVDATSATGNTRPTIASALNNIIFKGQSGSTSVTVPKGAIYNVMSASGSDNWYISSVEPETPEVPDTLELLDEDDFASDSATAVPSQQSVKAYVDNAVDNIDTTGTPATDSGAITTVVGNRFAWSLSSELPDWLLPLNGQTINAANVSYPDLWEVRSTSTLIDSFDDDAKTLVLKNYNSQGRFARAGTTAGVEQDDATALNGLKYKVSRHGNHQAVYRENHYSFYNGGSTLSSATDTIDYNRALVGDAETRPINVSEIWCVIAKPIGAITAKAEVTTVRTEITDFRQEIMNVVGSASDNDTVSWNNGYTTSKIKKDFDFIEISYTDVKRQGASYLDNFPLIRYSTDSFFITSNDNNYVMRIIHDYAVSMFEIFMNTFTESGFTINSLRNDGQYILKIYGVKERFEETKTITPQSLVPLVLPVSEVASSDLTAPNNTKLLIDCSAAPIVVTPPANPQKNDQFAVVDVTSSSLTNNITIDFSSAKFASKNNDYIINKNGATLEFTYINEAIGWIL